VFLTEMGGMRRLKQVVHIVVTIGQRLCGRVPRIGEECHHVLLVFHAS